MSFEQYKLYFVLNYSFPSLVASNFISLGRKLIFFLLSKFKGWRKSTLFWGISASNYVVLYLAAALISRICVYTCIYVFYIYRYAHMQTSLYIREELSSDSK